MVYVKEKVYLNDLMAQSMMEIDKIIRHRDMEN